MKALYTAFFILSLFMTISAQGSWESYNHGYLANKPLNSYPWNGGIITINSHGSTVKSKASLYEKPHSTNIKFIDENGVIHHIGYSAEFYGNVIDDIKIQENVDGSLSILLGKLFDYDIGFPYHRFDISSDTVISYTSYDEFEYSYGPIQWSYSEFPIGMIRDKGYVVARDEFIYVLDNEFMVIDTLDIPNQEFKICQLGDIPILYNQTQIVRVDPESLSTETNSMTGLQTLAYVDNHLFAASSSSLTISDPQFIQEYTWNLPFNTEILNITGSSGEYFLTIRNTASNVMSLWEATVGEDVSPISANLAEAGAIMAVDSDSTYRYTTTVEMSDQQQQSLVNRTLRDGTYESDYDYVSGIDLFGSDITLDSIVYGYQYFAGPDTFAIYSYYYNGELHLVNNTNTIIHSANVYSEWLDLFRFWPNVVHFNYRLDTPLDPGETAVFKVKLRSQQELPDTQLSFYCYGYNDRRLETPIEAVANVIASNDEIPLINFNIYPNPAQDRLTISVSEDVEIAHVLFFWPISQVIYRRS